MTAAPHDRVRGERVYRALLHLYPAGFRARYAPDLLDFYRRRVTNASLARFARIWLQLVPDLLATAAAEHFAGLHRELDPAPRVSRLYSHRREDTMSILVQDVRHALRGMLHRPGFSIVVLTTLALGIGANAAIFTVVNGVLLRPLPFAHADRIVQLENGDPYFSVSAPEFLDYARGVKDLSKLAAYTTPSVTIATAGDDPVRTSTARVSREFFEIMGVKPALGRSFAPDEFDPASRTAVVVIAHRLWVQRFGADPGIVGKSMTINGTPVTIIGVMPGTFTFPGRDAALWTPWRLNPDSVSARNNHFLRVVGLLRAGATVEQTSAEARTLNARWMHEYPETYFPDKPIVAQVTPIRDVLLGPTRPYLTALLGAVGFILLIACVNVANLLIARGESRRKEFAIRAALGASSGRVIRQLLTESVLFAFLGALLGIALAWAGTRALVALAPADLPRVDQVSVDGRVVLFTIAITLVTALAFGLFPALRMRPQQIETLREGGKTSNAGATRGARRGLVVAEITLAVVMLTGAGLLIRSLVKLRQTDLGFDPTHVLTMQVSLPPKKYNDTTSDEFFRQLLRSAAALPGVTAIGADAFLPITGSDNGWSILIDGRVVKTIAEAATARPEIVTPGYFHAMGVRVVRGRGFNDQDRRGAPLVAVISEAMARKLWPGADPVGHTLRMFDDKSQWATVVGVARDVRARGLQEASPETMYFPYSQAPQSAYYAPLSMSLVARAAGDPAQLVGPLRSLVRSMDGAAAISEVATMDDVVGDSIASRRFTTTLLGAFAALALVLAGIGTYGVISYGVSQRTYEIGVRLAMGATPWRILRLVVGEGIALAGTGLLVGIVSALAVNRLLSSMLVGVSGTDAVTLAAITALLAAVALTACLLPAHRASVVSPTEALRRE